MNFWAKDNKITLEEHQNSLRDEQWTNIPQSKSKVPKIGIDSKLISSNLLLQGNCQNLFHSIYSLLYYLANQLAK